MLGQPKSAQPLEVLRPGDLISDNRLAPDEQDLLEHDAIARGVAEIAWQAEAPVNIALFGPWGSGKSSVYSMIEKHLNRIAPKRVRIARYDAWKYGGRELKRNFIDSLARELGLDKEPAFSKGLEQDQVDTRLNTKKWFTDNWRSLLFGAGLAVAVAAMWVVVQAVAAVLLAGEGFNATATNLVTQAGTVFGLALVATLVGPKVFEGAVTTTKTPAPEGSDQFAKRFADLVGASLKGKHERLVVFIDELDRCDPKDVVATLIDLKTFLDQDKCAFIVAADREVIERALREVPQAKPVREDEPYYATPGAFLDKIFQHQLCLPPLRSRALTKFAHDLVDDQGGIWKELRAHGKDTFDRTVFALVPVHVRSPRRVKVLLNNYATSARIAQSRGIGWLDRAHEIAVFTVLQTEFPAVADDLRRVPRLLVYLRGEEKPTGDVRMMVDRYRPDTPTSPNATPQPTGDTEDREQVENDATEAVAGRLLSDDQTPSGARERTIANATLRRHLSNYLAKVAAAGIRDPRPDLLYLQAAGGREALTDPKLGDAIDFATDTAPDAVVEAFAREPSSTLAIAIPLLVTEGDNETGPGRAFAYESACRLVERLDPDDHEVVAQHVAPSLIAAATARSLSDASLPGGLLIACWTGASHVVDQVLAKVAKDGPTENLLDGLTVLLRYLGDDQRLLLVTLLADQFDVLHQPLLRALREAPVGTALKLWNSVADRVRDVLNELELPEPAPASQPAAPTRTAAQATAAAPAVPEPTGVGISLLEEIVEVVHERHDHEPLLSAVIATGQSQAAAEPLRDWVVTNVDSLVGTMPSPARRAWHALAGMSSYRGAQRESWATLLPECDDAGAGDTAPDAHSDEIEGEVNQLATQLLLGTLLPAFATAGDSELRTLPALVAKVADWGSASEEEIARSVAAPLEEIGWEGASANDASGQLLWDRKEGLVGTVAAISSGDDSPMFDPFVTDLATMLTSISLTEFATSNWKKLAQRLPKRAAEELSAKVDEYEPAANEAAAALELRLAVRAIYGGAAPSGAELAQLEPAQQTTALTGAWLALGPHPDEVRSLLPAVRFGPTALRHYCETLDTNQRTDLWLTLADNNAADGTLQAAGAGGLGTAAIEQVRRQIALTTREPERSALAARLMTGKPAADVGAAVKKAVSDLAMDLLAMRTAGDLRTAADLILWVGGAGHGHTQTLRQKFNEVASTHPKALPQSAAQRLASISLLNPPKEKRRSSLFRR